MRYLQLERYFDEITLTWMTLQKDNFNLNDTLTIYDQIKV